MFKSLGEYIAEITAKVPAPSRHFEAIRKDDLHFHIEVDLDSEPETRWIVWCVRTDCSGPARLPDPRQSA